MTEYYKQNHVYITSYKTDGHSITSSWYLPFTLMNVLKEIDGVHAYNYYAYPHINCPHKFPFQKLDDNAPLNLNPTKENMAEFLIENNIYRKCKHIIYKYPDDNLNDFVNHSFEEYFNLLQECGIHFSILIDHKLLGENGTDFILKSIKDLRIIKTDMYIYKSDFIASFR